MTDGKRQLDRLRKTSRAFSGDQSIDNYFNMMTQTTVKLRRIGQRVNFSINADSHISLLKQIFEQVSVLGRHEDCSVLAFLIQVRDRIHLAQIMRSVKNMPNVMRVTRDCA